MIRIVRTKDHIPLFGTVLSVMATGKGFTCSDGRTMGMECQAHAILCRYGEVFRTDVFKQGFRWSNEDATEQEVEHIAVQVMNN